VVVAEVQITVWVIIQLEMVLIQVDLNIDLVLEE
jgi:hypothetical protein